MSTAVEGRRNGGGPTSTVSQMATQLAVAVLVAVVLLTLLTHKATRKPRPASVSLDSEAEAVSKFTEKRLEDTAMSTPVPQQQGAVVPAVPATSLPTSSSKPVEAMRSKPPSTPEAPTSPSGASGPEDATACPDWNCKVENDCVSTVDGRCSKASEAFTHFNYQPKPGPNRIVPSGGAGDHKELRCSWQVEDPVSLPKLDLDPTAPSDPKVQWRNFKHLTGGYFRNWYEIDAPITKTTGDGSFRFSAGVQGHDQVYVMKNLCIRPNGRLAGFKPPPKSTWPRFTGESEWGGYRFYNKIHRPAFNHWMIDEFDELQSEPTWFVDQRLAILPIVDQVSSIQNSVHYMYRDATLIYNIAHGIPEPLDRVKAEGEEDWARKDFTTLYLRFNPRFARPWRDVLHDTGHWRFTTLASRSHMFAYASYPPDSAMELWRSKTEVGRNFSGSTEDLLAAFNRPVCFREAVFSQACAAGDCKTPARDPTRDSWMAAGQVKTAKTNRVIARRFRACAAVDSTFTEKPNGPPRVLYSQRTRYRGLLHRAYQLGELVKWLKASAPGATLTVSEVTKKGRSIPESVAILAQTDIIVGAYGGGLSYSFVMPERSSQMIILGLATMRRPGKDVGTDHDKANDFGGMLAALGGHETFIQPEAVSAFRLPSYKTELSVDEFKRGVYSAMCHYFIGSQQPAASENLQPALAALSLPKTCWLSRGKFEQEASLRVRRDADGYSLVRSIKAHYPPSVPSLAPRLTQLLQNAANYSASFAHVRRVREVEGAAVAMLVAFSLPEERHGRGGDGENNDRFLNGGFLKEVGAEILALRDHVPFDTMIHVIFTGRKLSPSLNTTLWTGLGPSCITRVDIDAGLDAKQDCLYCAFDQDPAQDGIRCRRKFVWREKTANGKTWFSELRTTTTKRYDAVVADTRVMKTHGGLIRKVLGRDDSLIVLDAL